MLCYVMSYFILFFFVLCFIYDFIFKFCYLRIFISLFIYFCLSCCYLSGSRPMPLVLKFQPTWHEDEAQDEAQQAKPSCQAQQPSLATGPNSQADRKAQRPALWPAGFLFAHWSALGPRPLPHACFLLPLAAYPRPACSLLLFSRDVTLPAQHFIFSFPRGLPSHMAPRHRPQTWPASASPACMARPGPAQSCLLTQHGPYLAASHFVFLTAGMQPAPVISLQAQDHAMPTWSSQLPWPRQPFPMQVCSRQVRDTPKPAKCFITRQESNGYTQPCSYKLQDKREGKGVRLGF